MTTAINLEEKFSKFTDLYTPKIIAESNGQLVKLAKVQGEFVWHQHEHEDELFLVVKGKLTIQMRDKNIELGPGEMCVVPKGVEHCPKAEGETHIMLIEPKSTQHTGETESERTVSEDDQRWI